MIICWCCMVRASRLEPVNLRDSLLAALVATIWGFNFVVIDWGMEGVPPLLFAAVRFTAVLLPALFLVRRPDAPWRVILGCGCLHVAGTVRLPLRVDGRRHAAGAGRPRAAGAGRPHHRHRGRRAPRGPHHRPGRRGGARHPRTRRRRRRSWWRRTARGARAVPAGRAVLGLRQRDRAGRGRVRRAVAHRVVGPGRPGAAAGAVPAGGRAGGGRDGARRLLLAGRCLDALHRGPRVAGRVRDLHRACWRAGRPARWCRGSCSPRSSRWSRPGCCSARPPTRPRPAAACSCSWALSSPCAPGDRWRGSPRTSSPC